MPTQSGREVQLDEGGKLGRAGAFSRNLVSFLFLPKDENPNA